MNIHERFEQFHGEYIKFERVENKLNARPDLHAFLWLDRRFPNPGRDMVCSAEHDEIWLDVDENSLNELTDAEIIDLVRCGVRHDNDCGLCMFA